MSMVFNLLFAYLPFVMLPLVLLPLVIRYVAVGLQLKFEIQPQQEIGGCLRIVEIVVYAIGL